MARQISLVRDNFYGVFNSSRNSKSLENFFKFKILKWPLAVISHYFPSTDNSIL